MNVLYFVDLLDLMVLSDFMDLLDFMNLSDLMDLSNLSKTSIFGRVLVPIVKTSLFGQVCFRTKYGNSGHGGLCRHYHGAPAATRSLIRRWLMTLVANGLASRGWGWLAKQTDTEDLTLLKLKLYYTANVYVLRLSSMGDKKHCIFRFFTIKDYDL